MKIITREDKGKAISLLNMAKITLERLESTNITGYPSNSLIDYYNTIHYLMESLCTIDGVKFSGEGSHYELIKYVCKQYNFDERFIQQIRDYRNRISYDGFNIKKSYIIQNKDSINKIIKNRKVNIEEKL
ncbi:MAG: hypothetical protein ACOCUR_00470 [Nanoarchaeota archaeon]